MRLRVLGPVEVRVGDSWTSFRAAMERSLLACLAVHAGTPVSADWLVDQLWPADRAPRRPRKRVQALVWRLRNHLQESEGDLLRTTGTGYVLQLDDGGTDAAHFEDLAGSGTSALRDGDPERAARTLNDALALWRGPAYADAGSVPAVVAEAERLEQLRLAATEDQIDAELRCGRHPEQVSPLQALAAHHPYRERITGLLMLALYRCGRQADALDVFSRARSLLADELGIDPGNHLRQLHQQILESDPALAAPTATVTVSSALTAQLPGDLAAFSGREGDVSRLLKLGDTAATATTAVTATISGTAGIGKTTLAIHAAHQMADQFPDGQLYVDLRGFDTSEGAMGPAEATRGFLAVLGVPAEKIPADPEAQTALYRSLLHDRRILLVLDNAHDSDQIRPLLPGTPGCLTLVTSRGDLSGLVTREAATPLTLELLTKSDARQLLADRLGADRVTTEPDAVDAIVDACAGLPLALAVVAARAATHPRFRLEMIATELRSGLDALAGGEARSDVRTVFSWSYEQLSPQAARLFRLLGLHPGPDVSAAATASLAGLPPGHTAPLLKELTYAGLVTEHIPGRYSFHDLLRVYAAELSHTHDSTPQRHEAIRRALDHYVHSAYAPTLMVNPVWDPIPVSSRHDDVTPETVATRAEALSWFDTEHHVLLTVVEWANALEYDEYVGALAWALNLYLGQHWYRHERVRVWQLAIAAARRSGDTADEARARRQLGRAYAQLGRLDDAQCQMNEALNRYRKLGESLSEARTRRMLADVFDKQERFAEAIDQAWQAVEIYRISEHRSGLADALNSLGWYCTRASRHEQAIEYCEEALVVLVDVEHNEALVEATSHSLGHAHHHLGHFETAVGHYQRALALTYELDNRYIRGQVLADLGDSQLATGDSNAAAASWRDALMILEEIEHPRVESVRKRIDALEDESRIYRR